LTASGYVAQYVVLMVPNIDDILGLRGKPVTKSGAAPATVSGEPEAIETTERAGVWEGGKGEEPQARRPAISAESSSGGVPRREPRDSACWRVRPSFCHLNYEGSCHGLNCL
jgi:hypothetical protein